MSSLMDLIAKWMSKHAISIDKQYFWIMWFFQGILTHCRTDLQVELCKWRTFDSWSQIFLFAFCIFVALLASYSTVLFPKGVGILVDTVLPCCQTRGNKSKLWSSVLRVSGHPCCKVGSRYTHSSGYLSHVRNMAQNLNTVSSWLTTICIVNSEIIIFSFLPILLNFWRWGFRGIAEQSRMSIWALE